MSRFSPESLSDLLARVQAAAASGANAVAHMAGIAKSLRELPPPDGALMTRNAWERATLFSWAGVIEDLAIDEERTFTIEAPHDLWIRGVVAGCIPNLAVLDESPEDLIEIFAPLRQSGTNYRALFDYQFRLDGRIGFQSRGTAAAFAPTPPTTGDGTYIQPMDWRIQRDQALQVTIRNRTAPLFAGVNPPIPGLELRLVTLVFWCIQLNGMGAGIYGGSSLGP